MHVYNVTIKEKGKPNVIKTSYRFPVPRSRQHIIDWFGLEEDDVESYEIEHIEQ